MREALVFPDHIVTHEVPRPSRVRAIAAQLRRGEAMPPLQLSPEFCEHWRQGPTRMESTGVGYGLIDGHHRLAAHIMVHGRSTPLQADFHGARPIEGPAARGSQQSSMDFQSWFGKGQIVDDHGQPQVVYHGTMADFKTPRMNGSGLFFVTPDKASVAEFVDGRPGARVMDLYANIRNAFDATDRHSIDAVVDEGRKRGWIRGDVATLTYDGGRVPISLSLLRTGDHVAIESREVVAAVKAMGHDGIKLLERGMTNYAVFEPRQIRNASDWAPAACLVDRQAAAEEAMDFIAKAGRKVAPHA